MEAYLGHNGEVVIDGRIVPGAFGALQKHLAPRIVYYIRNVANDRYYIAMLDANTYEVWRCGAEPIGPNGELIIQFGGANLPGEFIDAFAEAINFCVWADSYA